MEQILVSEDCTQQSEHIDTKKLQASMSRSLIILEDVKKVSFCLFSFLSELHDECNIIKNKTETTQNTFVAANYYQNANFTQSNRLLPS